MYDFMIIGGGIVGLSVGVSILERQSNAKVLVLEKEEKLAQHQTGNNSGVIHSGIYYKPESFKAKFAKAGSESMRQFAAKHNISHDICGKVIVATCEKELVHLENLYKRGLDNGLSIEKLSKEQLLEKEPHVNGLKAIHVPTAGIIDYKQVSEKLAELIRLQNGVIENGAEVQSIDEGNDRVTIETGTKTYTGKFLINCAGLQSDRIAKMAGYLIDMKIVPFRGEYFVLKEDKQNLVKNLIYPVPNPDFPFLGVHFTRMINGKVDVGPNAVPAFKREAYKKTDFNIKDFAEMVTYPGFLKLAMKYPLDGLGEMYRSFVKSKFVQSAQVLIPEITGEDLIQGPAGVRAQGLKADGTLVDDFYIVNGKKSIHVCNAPSPAATAALEIGKAIAEQVPKLEKTSLIIG